MGSTRVVTDNVGLITDRYTYDAFGVLLDQSGTFGNSSQFAGEQRDSETGLDYLRARYYDPLLGRFVSKDAFGGFMDDPTSQNPYVYANNNPVRYTDPSGYFSIGELAAGISIMGILASIGGSAGYVGASYLTGAASSPEDLLNFADQWVAGFAHAVSFGQSTRYRNWAYGEVANQNHQGFLWNMGILSGVSVSLLTGLRVSQTLTFGMGTAQWLVVAQSAGSTFTAAYDAGSRVRDKGIGGLEWQDTFLLLPFIPYAASAAKTFIANAKAVNGSLKNWGQMKVGSSVKPVGKPVTGECFVAGTEILTTEGIKNIEDIQVGDWVIADDPNTVGEIEAKQVLDAFVRHTNKLVDLYIDGELISTTEEHPFWTPDHGWVKAKDLHVGSLLQTEDGRIIDIDKIEKREGDFTVYNFKVEGFHTYFVSDLGILVHNAPCGGIQSSTTYENGNVRFDYSPIGDNPLPPTVTVGKDGSGGLILDHINKRGYANGAGHGSEMLAEAATRVGLPKPTKITAPNIINPNPEKIAELMQNAARRLGGTPSSVKIVDNGVYVQITMDITY